MISEHRDFYVSERRNYHYEKNKRIFCGYDGNCFCHKTGWNFDRCDRSAFRRDHRDADLTAQNAKYGCGNGTTYITNNGEDDWDWDDEDTE